MIFLFAFVVNAIGVLAGALTGLFLRDRIPKNLLAAVKSVLGLGTIVLGVQLFLKADFLLLLASLLVGTVVGELIGVDRALEKLANRIKAQTKSKTNTFSEGLVTAFLIFCVGPLTMLGQ